VAETVTSVRDPVCVPFFLSLISFSAPKTGRETINAVSNEKITFLLISVVFKKFWLRYVQIKLQTKTRASQERPKSVLGGG
jgi:hypothetical protein